uniref:E3 SUMO-protein ligase RanBP2 n=1 Tax=Anthurium amnicola TaxID=1678845 RepID=A0A1D1Y3J5_9ARAE
MGDAEGAVPPSKKRFAAGQLSRDNPGLDDDGPEPEMGTFQRASDEVLAARRIVKVRRHQPSAASAALSNPFAGLHFASATDSAAKAVTAEPHPPPTADSQRQPATESQMQPPDKEVRNTEDDNELKHENTDGNKGTENAIRGSEASGDGDERQNGQPDNNNQLENETGLSGDVSSENDKNEIVKETSCSGEAVKEAENGQHDVELEARASTEKAGLEIKNIDEVVQEARDESMNEKVGSDQKGKTESAGPLKSFHQLSSNQNAFSGLAGTGFSGSSFTFGTKPDGSSFGTSSGSLFGLNNDKPSYPSYNFGSVNHAASLKLFSTTPDSMKSGEGGIATLQEVPVETGEENEKVVFSADAVLFEYIGGGWKERGKGELKVNISNSAAERARLVMRAKGNYRLILNANLYPDMSLTNMEKRGITFACVNSASEGKGGLATFALKFKDASIVEEFRGAVTVHKGKKTTLLKTPENSPKASDD